MPDVGDRVSRDGTRTFYVRLRDPRRGDKQTSEVFDTRREAEHLARVVETLGAAPPSTSSSRKRCSSPSPPWTSGPPGPVPFRERLHTIREAAQLLNLRTNLIACWKRTGRVGIRGVVPSHRGGTEPLYRLSELEPLGLCVPPPP